MVVKQDRGVDWLTGVGLGLDYHVLRLDRTDERWIEAGRRLCDDVAARLVGVASGVEQIGSSSVNGLLAKPIIDIAVGVAADQELPPVSELFEAAGWIYRGDAGANGGQVFVLEARPSHRVAHAHVVEFDGEQWRKYLLFRDLLRRSAKARAKYEAVKEQVALEVGNDRTTYTDRKSIIESYRVPSACFQDSRYRGRRDRTGMACLRSSGGLHRNNEMHSVPGSELGFRRVVQDETGSDVERERVAVRGHFDATSASGSSDRGDIDNECASDAAAHPIGVDEQVIELVDVANRATCREPDDAFTAQGDPSSLLPN